MFTATNDFHAAMFAPLEFVVACDHHRTAARHWHHNFQHAQWFGHHPRC
jgi:hypothetical protein